MENTRNQQGFTLTEMMIVIAIIALIGSFVTVNVMKKLDEAKISSTKIQIKQLGVILDDYRRLCNLYPKTEQGLDALIKPPAECKNADPEGFIKGGKIPKDAWDNDFIYTSDGQKYLIKSLGGDRADGGTGSNADITSDNLD